jgi:hypothetical protein
MNSIPLCRNRAPGPCIREKQKVILALLAFVGLLLSARGAPAPVSAFGGDKSPAGEAALIGIFYDLKQTSDRKPANMNLDIYNQTIQNFVDSGWDESVLNKFYQVSEPRFATQIYVPLIDSSEAPRAFGIEKWVKGGFWLVHYKAQVVPPHDGTYRFVGWADCEIEVAVNEKLVLASNWFPQPRFSLQCPPASAPGVEGHVLQAGAWLNLKASEPVDLDILWGDNGGVCAAFLLLEEKGVTYQKDQQGFPILPVFQVAPYGIPPAAPGTVFQTAPKPVVWKALQ